MTTPTQRKQPPSLTVPDLAYEKARNSLLDEAERIADILRPRPPQGAHRKTLEYYYLDWNRCFSQTMERLWAERGEELYRKAKLKRRRNPCNPIGSTNTENG